MQDEMGFRLLLGVVTSVLNFFRITINKRIAKSVRRDVFGMEQGFSDVHR